MSQASHQFPPLRFQPIFRSYLWGGRNLESELKKPLPSEGIWAESWEIVDHPQAQSIVSDGPWTQWSLGELVKQHRHSILGPSANHPARFPLLLKYLDCQNVLSVQVHPDDAYGATLPTPDLGKTEAWVILATNPGAKLYAGLKSGVTKSILRDAIDKGTTESCLHVINPQPGDCIFIPAGTVHALGAGLLVAEIQQASDCTFRLYDWNRVDQEGKQRPLHVAQALDVIDFNRGPINPVSPQNQDASDASLETLVRCEKFTLQRYSSPKPIPLPTNTFHIITVPKGSGRVDSTAGSIQLCTGESALIPYACPYPTLTLAPNSFALLASCDPTT